VHLGLEGLLHTYIHTYIALSWSLTMRGIGKVSALLPIIPYHRTTIEPIACKNDRLAGQYSKSIEKIPIRTESPNTGRARAGEGGVAGGGGKGPGP
jgi:hypothetical protein